MRATAEILSTFGSLPRRHIPPKGPATKKYYAYLETEVWAERRRQLVQARGHRCERCDEASIQNVHHLTYERLYDERRDDLVGLCRECHAHLHGLALVAPPLARRVWPALYNATYQLCPRRGMRDAATMTLQIMARRPLALCLSCAILAAEDSPLLGFYLACA